jgi:lysophospholipase L1-like esterase
MLLGAFLLGLLPPAGARDAGAPAASILKKGHRVAVVGDSITEQKLYSRYIELYLLACLPELELRVVQLGWGGETAGGFANRMNYDLMSYKPDVVTTCYGMNDGGYKPFDEATGKRYHDTMADIVSRLKNAGATVVVGSPGAVDTKFFRGGGKAAAMYNATLSELRDIARKLADHYQMPFADVIDPMLSGMEAAKRALGEDYDVCGRDGVHPGPNGHLIMAYAFLKAMGLDGEIGTITLDAGAGTAKATDGHAILSADKGKVEVESRRYPFCFSGDEKAPGGTRSILPFVPFNQDLNRLTLVVRNLGGEKARVQWGAASKTLTKAELEKGVNLAEQFAENPFVESFRKLEGLVAAKQGYETVMIKQTVNSFPRLVEMAGKDPDVAASVEALRKQLFAVQERMAQNVRAAVVPVRHTISVTAE